MMTLLCLPGLSCWTTLTLARSYTSLPSQMAPLALCWQLLSGWFSKNILEEQSLYLEVKAHNADKTKTPYLQNYTNSGKPSPFPSPRRLVFTLTRWQETSSEKRSTLIGIGWTAPLFFECSKSNPMCFDAANFFLCILKDTSQTKISLTCENGKCI